MIKILFLTPIVLSFICGCATTKEQPREAWVPKSNQLAIMYTKELSQKVPDIGSYLGLREFDSKAVLMFDEWDDWYLTFNQSWDLKLQKMIEQEKDPNLLLDWQILRSSVQKNIDKIKVNRKVAHISLPQPTKEIFNSLSQ